jgi:hypothetical protein
MANKSVSLYRKCKTPDGWKRYRVVMSANGKVKPDAVIVGGVEAIFPTGHYELGSYAGKNRVWTRVKGNASDALAAWKTAQGQANAVAMAEAGVEVVKDPERIHLEDAAKEFALAAAARGSAEASEVYSRTLDDFLASCSKTYVDELRHKDILKFHAEMRKRGLADRTVHNRHMALRSFLLSLGMTAEVVKSIAGSKAPKFEKTMPEIYEPGELKKFFASLTTEYDRLLFDVLLKTGLRKREAMHVEWTDSAAGQVEAQVQT